MQQLVPIEGRRDVRLVDQYPIYELGGALQQLKEAAHVAARISQEPDSAGKVRDHIGALWLADYHLKALLNDTPFRVSFCRGSAQSLCGHISSLMQQINASATPGAAADLFPVEAWRWHAIRSGIEVFEHQFSAELQKTATYAVPDVGIFKTEGLVDSADGHIHESVREAVPRFAITEFQAAGRCLAFGLCSASGFHSARAVESALREYHKFYLPKQNSDEMTVGQMASALADMHEARKRAEALPKQNTVRHIKDFTDYDRNPLMHKNVVLEEIHAVTLFNSAASVIVEMAKELEALKAVSAFSVVSPFIAAPEDDSDPASFEARAASSDGQAS